MARSRKRISRKRKNALILIGLFLTLIGFMVFYVWIFNHTNMLYKEIETLSRKEAGLATQNRILTVQLEKLSRADRIQKIATTQLNMVTPAPETLAVVIRDINPD